MGHKFAWTVISQCRPVSALQGTVKKKKVDRENMLNECVSLTVLIVLISSPLMMD